MVDKYWEMCYNFQHFWNLVLILPCENQFDILQHKVVCMVIYLLQIWNYQIMDKFLLAYACVPMMPFSIRCSMEMKKSQANGSQLIHPELCKPTILHINQSQLRDNKFVQSMVTLHWLHSSSRRHSDLPSGLKPEGTTAIFLAVQDFAISEK